MAKPELTTAERLRKTSDIRGLRLDGQNWTFSYRFAGRARRMKIGTAPLLIPADARKAAQRLAGLVAIGRCPATERRTLAAESRLAKKPVVDHVENIAAQYLKWLRERVRPATYHETARVMAKEILPRWAGKRLGEISKSDVRKLVDGILRRGSPVSANRCLTSLKAWMNWCVSEDLIPVSPATGVRPPAIESPRVRVLDDSELSAVWRASLTLGEYGAGVRLLALTGQRRSEVFDMTWAEVDLASRTWTLPAHRAKNNRMHQIPLSPQAMEILSWIAPAFERARGRVFEPQSFSTAKVELAKLLPADMPGWVLHDLRRTCASGMAGLGVQPHIVEAVLNHRSGVIKGVASVYNRYSYSPEKRGALSLWADHVGAILTAPADTLTEAA